MENTVNLLYRDELDASDLNVMKIITFLGGEVNAIPMTSAPAPKGKRLVAGARTLAGTSPTGLDQWLLDLAPNVLVYGFGTSAGDSETVRRLTSGSLTGVEAVKTAGREIRVTSDLPDACRQFSGLNFDAAGPEEQFVFAGGKSGGECARVASLGDAPFFVRKTDRDRQLFLMAGPQVADLDIAVPRGTSVLRFFSELAPVMMFLRSGSKGEFWQGDGAAGCFVIDDPLLTQRYGFLDYRKLLDVMEREEFSTSVAFIPWNHRRSDRKTVELVKSRPGRYSLSVHGCDHTRGEFGDTDTAWLRERAQRALDKMRMHRQSSGVEFDEVMVFPQGIFSTAAMAALQACGYLAAVNSTAYPVDAPEALTLRDLLEVAVTRFSNFPLFTRRYPDAEAEFAFDLFVGKPALMVEHHGIFRDGYQTLAGAIQKLRRMDGRLRWGSLGAACSEACLKRVANDGQVHVWFFTDRFVLHNRTASRQNYVLSRSQMPGDGLTGMNSSDGPLEISRQGGRVVASISLAAGQSVGVKVERDRSQPLASPAAPKRLHDAKVFIRRRLCEFRDNYIDKSRILSDSARSRPVRATVASGG